MKTSFRIFCSCMLALQISFTATSQEPDAPSNPFDGIKLRSIGPAFMSGRISDIAIHPHNENMWYVAVGSGGVWKTSNAGTTWTPIFEKETSYSIGTVAIDPNRPETIWVGTGEDSGGRHIGFGDGVYRSDDGGQTWANMGLKETQHISRVIVHPENSSIVHFGAKVGNAAFTKQRTVAKLGKKHWETRLGPGLRNWSMTLQTQIVCTQLLGNAIGPLQPI